MTLTGSTRLVVLILFFVGIFILSTDILVWFYLGFTPKTLNTETINTENQINQTYQTNQTNQPNQTKSNLSGFKYFLLILFIIIGLGLIASSIMLYIFTPYAIIDGSCQKDISCINTDKLCYETIADCSKETYTYAYDPETGFCTEVICNVGEEYDFGESSGMCYDDYYDCLANEGHYRFIENQNRCKKVECLISDENCYITQLECIQANV